MCHLLLAHPRRWAAGLLLGGAVAGCGSVRPAPRATPAPPAGLTRGAITGATSALRPSLPGLPARSVPPRPGAPARRLPAARQVAVGTAQTVVARTGRLLVTVTAVLDPLRDAGAALPAGGRPVGVALELRVLSGSYDSTASGDVVLMTTDGAAPPAFVARGACATHTVDFESEVSAGEQRGGCVAFAVAARARVLAVGFRPDAQAAGEVVWALRPGSAG
jgi:hypothetical protein